MSRVQAVYWMDSDDGEVRVKKIRAADLFCGAGGTSIGAHQTGGVDVSFAVNHWDVAIKTHSANFPRTKHVQTELRWVRPTEAERINLLFASPECTHHSRARGGRPTTDQQRAGAWELLPWIEHHRPSFVVVENVVEFSEWGPVSHKSGRPLKSLKGKFFEAWIAAIQSAGYRVDFRRLNAADFGAATSRERLFVVAKKGNRSPCFPEPTHCRSTDTRLPGFEMMPWRGAIEIIDWSIPLPSVFGRSRPLADKTLARIRKGLERHVAPFITKYNGDTSKGDYRKHSLNDTLRTIDTSNRFGVIAPFVASVNHGDDGTNGVRSKPITETLGTVTTRNGRAVIAPFIAQFDNASGNRVPKSMDSPIGTIVTKNGQAIAAPLVMAPQSGGVAKQCGSPVPPITTAAGSQLIVPWLTSFYGTQNTSPSGSPVPTITTVDRHAATAAVIGGQLPEAQTNAERDLQDCMKQLGVVDIGFRMLSNGELANAQGFPMSYEFCGTKKDVTKQIGNSVSPPVAKAITEALLG